MRCFALLIAFAAVVAAQQVPFIHLAGPHAPQGASILLKDSVRGGIWLGSASEAGEGLTYFDGIRFISPLRQPFPKIEITGMAEDADGGIWLAAYNGVFRAFRGQLQSVVSGRAPNGIVQAGPELLLASVTNDVAQEAELLRIGRGADGRWKAASLLHTAPGTRFQPDGAGHILFACAAGYCEFSESDVARWHPGQALPVIAHSVRQFRVDRESFILKDRFGCVWQRGRDSGYDIGTLAYECPESEQIYGPMEKSQKASDLIGLGGLTLSETDDGSILVPSFGKLAIGRPGHFRVYTAVQGYAGAMNAICTPHGIWMSNGNGLFVMPKRDRIEFWTDRDGLDGNTWSIVRTAGKTFAVAGQTLRVLNADHTRWDLLPSMPNLWHLSAGTDGRVLASTGTGQVQQLSRYGQSIGALHSVETDLSGAESGSDPAGDLRACWNALKPFGQNRTLGLLSEVCVSFVKDGQRETWRPTTDGIALTQDVNGARARMRAYRSGGEVGIGTVRFFGIDRRGWIWRGSPVGVYVADPEQAEQGKWLYLNHLDGIAGTDANTGSFFSDPDGSVWFGADNSINHIYPSTDLVRPRETPAIFISSFSLDSGGAQMADMVGNIKSHTKITAHIGLRDYYHPNALRFRYRIAPDESAWREVKSADLELGLLPSGSHTLEVQGRLFGGPWSGTVRREVMVLRPVWATVPFLAMYGMCGAVLWASWEWLRRRRLREERALMPDLRDLRTNLFLPEGHQVSGTVLDGRFEVGRLLASGGFATVMAAYDLNLHRNCAIKIFRSEAARNESIQRSFEQEVVSLRKISHPNIVHIYDDGITAEGAPYLVMEFIEGKSLREILKNGPLLPRRAGRVLDHLASALDAIHACGIFHRDVKPENILLRKTAGRNGTASEQAVLIDFSIAIIKSADETLHGISRAAGTFDYMAPEQALGYARSSSDIFSLAKVVIEMLFGQRLSELLPNDGLELPMGVRQKLAVISPWLSEESIQMLASALEFDPIKRPRIASEFALPLVRDLNRRIEGRSGGVRSH